MNSHELARLLLTLPDLPVATHANNHTYMSGINARTHGPLKVGRLHTYGGDHIVLGNISRLEINPPNWYVVEMLRDNEQHTTDAAGTPVQRPVGRPAPERRADGMPVSADERKLRRMYAVRVGVPNLYMDDGEASGSEHGIQIDFMRDPVAEIAAKVLALEVARYECSKTPNAELTGPLAHAPKSRGL